MALSMPVLELENGLTVTNSYVLIYSFSGNNTQMNIELRFYMNKEASREGKTPLKIKGYTLTINRTEDAKNYHKQAYEYLKTLAEFSNAVDVLEDGQY